MVRLACLGLFFRLFTDPVHGLDGLDRVLAGSRFGRQHHRVGAIHDRIGHVKNLGPGGNRVLDHRFHHLGGRDHHAVHLARGADQVFLRCRQFGVADLNTKITACDHDDVRGIDDLLNAVHGLGTLDLGHDVPMATCLAQQLPRNIDVFRRAHEGNGQIIGLDAGGKLDVLFVFIGQCRCGEAAAQFIDALAVGQGAANHYLAAYFPALDLIDPQHDMAVVQQQ